MTRIAASLRAAMADDVGLLRLAVAGLEGFGRDETALLGVHRQLGDSLRRLAESQVRPFHAQVDQRLGAQGHPEHTWTDDLNRVAASLIVSLERTLALLYRRHLEHYILDVTVVRAEASMERAGLARRRPERPSAIAFLDLAGYTRLTEERGDRAAAELAARLAEIVHELAHGLPGRRPFRPDRQRRGQDHRLRPTRRGPGQRYGHRRRRHLEAVRYQPVGPVSLKGLTAPIGLYTAARDE